MDKQVILLLLSTFEQDRHRKQAKTKWCIICISAPHVVYRRISPSFSFSFITEQEENRMYVQKSKSDLLQLVKLLLRIKRHGTATVCLVTEKTAFLQEKIIWKHEVVSN